VTLLAVSAVGPDRPGIVAALASALYEHGANLEDTSMTILRGHFAMTLIVAAEPPAGPLEAALSVVAGDLGLVLSVREVAAEAEHQPVRPYVVSVYGADHPGIVARIAAVLAAHDVNITDLTTRLVDDAALYAMVLDVDLPPAADEAEVAAALAAVAAELDVEATIRPAEPDIL
jgi:glycine cleavage system transcriptional repressor